MSSEAASIRRFVRGQLRGQPDLSSLTVGILKRRYMAQVGCESLSPSAKCLMKQVIEEELMKMQDDDNNRSEPETKMTQNKRKRDRESDTSESDGEAESRSKKSRRHLNSSSESEDKEDCRTGREGIEAEAQNKRECGDEEVTESHKTNVHVDQQVKSTNSSDEETNEEKSSNTSKGIKSEESNEEDECDADTKPNQGDTCNSSESADSEKEEKQQVKKEPDTLSVPSLDDDQENAEKKVTVKKKRVKKENGGGGNASKEDNKTVLRLKRYISLCGVRRNYKKLLDGCRTVRSMVATLKKELEDLGVEGQPTIKKCKNIRKKREEDQELAALDVNNIIVTQGRSKRRGVSAHQEQHDSPASVYQRSVNSSSDSDQENKAHRGRQRVTNWANLHGIISDDGASD